ncbi:hypothetical protein TSOC_006513 [Tetrabaena socialis]|uniref:Uncharacterized protein n=1 Tax=Tetrabaena socialis TaxID=47790 RepID=A0A2J8A3I7_9CHLO|nr:hypothetical protein TSOC_006513 [Tetrabaena socialis]|eukprot:PNH07066.1 hypothetical protein TSOC_006513 [Tetrabaena socialis]
MATNAAAADLVPLISRYFGRTVAAVPAARATASLASSTAAPSTRMTLSDGDSPGFRVVAMSAGGGAMMAMSAGGGAGAVTGVRFLSMLNGAKRAAADPIMAEAISKYF